jgi:uncharacterized membrane protein
LTTLDLIALGGFIGAWIIYALSIELTGHKRSGLNAMMDVYREVWMRRMVVREQRMVDMQIMAALQNGTAFFASTSLIAVGGSLTLLRSADEVLTVMSSLPFAVQTTRTAWEAKVIGLAIIFVYAFFKFAWSYRLYNYVAILFGAMPLAQDKDTPEANAHVLRTAGLFRTAGRHFNRGQRAFFFALAYLGWFISPWLLMITTVAAVIVMWSRQFISDSRRAVLGDGTQAVTEPKIQPPELGAGNNSDVRPASQ